jgi:hypothetical protein
MARSHRRGVAPIGVRFRGIPVSSRLPVRTAVDDPKETLGKDALLDQMILDRRGRLGNIGKYFRTTDSSSSQPSLPVVQIIREPHSQPAAI